MSNDNKFFLCISDSLALHFSKAVTATHGVRLEPITRNSFANQDTALITFATEEDAEVYKDGLCTRTAYAVNMGSVRQCVLESFCALQVKHLERHLEAA